MNFNVIKQMIKSSQETQRLIKKIAGTKRTDLGNDDAKKFMKMQMALGKFIRNKMIVDVMDRVDDCIQHGDTFFEAIDHVSDEGFNFDLMDECREITNKFAEKLNTSPLSDSDIADVLENRFKLAVKLVNEKSEEFKEKELNADESVGNLKFWEEALSKDFGEK